MHGYGNKKNKPNKIGTTIFKVEVLMNKLKEKSFMKQKDQTLWDLILKEKIQIQDKVSFKSLKMKSIINGKLLNL
jgi:hypothetical protein